MPALQHWTTPTPEVPRLAAVYLAASAFFAVFFSLTSAGLASDLPLFSALAAEAGVAGVAGITLGVAGVAGVGVVANAATEKAPTIKEAISLFIKVSFRL